MWIRGWSEVQSTDVPCVECTPLEINIAFGNLGMNIRYEHYKIYL